VAAGSGDLLVFARAAPVNGLCSTSEAEFDALEAESDHSPGDFASRANG
jgi:hypothetical protein